MTLFEEILAHFEEILAFLKEIMTHFGEILQLFEEMLAHFGEFLLLFEEIGSKIDLDRYTHAPNEEHLSGHFCVTKLTKINIFYKI